MVNSHSKYHTPWTLQRACSSQLRFQANTEEMNSFSNPCLNVLTVTHLLSVYSGQSISNSPIIETFLALGPGETEMNTTEFSTPRAFLV